MKDMEPQDDDRFAAADLSPDQLDNVLTLEENLRSHSNKDIVLIAYEETEHHRKE